jgi:hypothetical protein
MVVAGAAVVVAGAAVVVAGAAVVVVGAAVVVAGAAVVVAGAAVVVVATTPCFATELSTEAEEPQPAQNRKRHRVETMSFCIAGDSRTWGHPVDEPEGDKYLGSK